MNRQKIVCEMGKKLQNHNKLAEKWSQNDRKMATKWQQTTRFGFIWPQNIRFKGLNFACILLMYISSVISQNGYLVVEKRPKNRGKMALKWQ